MNILSFIKFGIVGFSGLLVDFSITWCCKEKLKINKYISNSLGFVFGVINNYYWNRTFTFNAVGGNFEVQFLKFLLVSLIGFLLNNFLLFLFQNKTAWNFYISKAVVTVIVFFWNFFANTFFTFN